MTHDEAKATVLRTMKPVAEHGTVLNAPARLADELTEEHEWGWLFVFVPAVSEGSVPYSQQIRFALDRVNGNATPVGNKGLDEAVPYLKRWRKSAQPLPADPAG